MGTIIPAILPRSREDLIEKLSRIRGHVTEIQIDSVDGKFIGPASWPYESAESSTWFAHPSENHIPELEAFQFEADLMVHTPEDALASWIRLGANRIVVHAESTPFLAQVIEDLQKTYGHERGFAPQLLSFGLALSIDTDTSMIEPFLHACDFVQFMGIAHIGRQGEPFDTRVLRKITAFKRAHPDVPMQVDGGVSLETLPKILQAGVSRCIVGSALWNTPDVIERLHELQRIADSHLYT